MNACILDTDILMPLFKGAPSVVARAHEYRSQHGFLNITIVTYYRDEVMKGHEYIRAYDRQAVFEDFCRLNQVLPLDRVACQAAARIYAELRRRGDLIPDADVLIAGIAPAGGYTLVTQNVKHFKRINGLQVENWAS